MDAFACIFPATKLCVRLLKRRIFIACDEASSCLTEVTRQPILICTALVFIEGSR